MTEAEIANPCFSTLFHREYFFNSDDTIEMISSLISLMKPFSDFLHVFKETRTSFPAPAVPFAQLGPSPFTLISYLQSHLWSYSPVYIHCFHFRVFAICCLLCLYFHPQIFTWFIWPSPFRRYSHTLTWTHSHTTYTYTQSHLHTFIILCPLLYFSPS